MRKFLGLFLLGSLLSLHATEKPYFQSSFSLRKEFTSITGYPKEWDYIEFKEIFDLLPNVISTSKGFCQWMNMVKACFNDPKFGPLNLSRSLYDLGKQAHRGNPHLKTWIAVYFNCRPEWLQMWFEEGEAQIKNFTPQILSNTLYALAQLNIQPDPTWLAAWYKKSYHELKNFNVQDFNNCLLAFAQLNTQPDPSWLAAWYKMSCPQMRGFYPQAFSNTLYALAQLNIQPDLVWLDAWYKESLPQLKQFNPQAMSNTLYALARLNIQPDPIWITAWYRESLLQLKQFNPQAFSNTLYALAQLYIQPDPVWLAAWYKESFLQLKKFSPQALSNSLYALALMNLEPAITWLNCFNACAKKIRAWPIEDFHQLILAYHHLNYPSQEVIPQEIYKKMREKIKRQRTKTSQLQKSVATQLRSLGIEFEEEVFIEFCLKYVDIYLPQNKLIIEVDGPTHFMRDGKTYNPATDLITRLLKKQGYQVRRISYEAWGRAQNKANLLKQLVPFESQT